MKTSYRAYVVDEGEDGSCTGRVVERPPDRLPPGDVLMRVTHSSLNYKDALSATGNRGVTRRYPHVPGIDAAGVVEESGAPDLPPGTQVLVTGYELGSNHDGGWAEYARVPASWVVPLPATLTGREAMILGTAGFTAGLAVHRLLHHGVRPEQGPVLVTGASGGVGCLAVAILARAGFAVAASTGKEGARDLLRSFGAAEILGRSDVPDATGKALLAGRWAGTVETVGGAVLDSVLRSTKPFGAVAACGNILSAELHTSVYPFILRGVALLGINSAFTPMPLRREIWNLLAGAWKPAALEACASEIALEDLPPAVGRILRGGVQGRLIVIPGA